MDSLELKPLVHLLQHNGGCWRGGFLVFLADNLGNLYRINKGRARHVTRAHELLRELYALADGNDIEFIALWLPVSWTAPSTPLSKCRFRGEALVGATAAGAVLIE